MRIRCLPKRTGKFSPFVFKISLPLHNFVSQTKELLNNEHCTYLNEHGLRFLRRKVQNFFLCLAELCSSFVMLFLLLLDAADRVFPKALQWNNDLVMCPVKL